ncbi:MAG: nuclear transport factor 2 family protein [Myxococcota bacterium]
MKTNQQVWERYVAAWRAPTLEEKRALLLEAVSPACVYTDPSARLHGHGALIEYMLAFHRQVPGGHFVTEQFFAHHQQSAARWTMRGPDSEILGDGVSHGAYDEGGQLVQMTGFYDPPGAD